MHDLTDHIGSWTGSWRTYLRPDELYDESPVTATIRSSDDGFTIEYTGSIQGDPVTGRMLWSETDDDTAVDWVDSWHTQGERQRLVGSDSAPPSYQYGDDDPWTWDIAIGSTSDGVTVTHHNAGPGIPRYVGVVMSLDTRRS